MKKYSMSHQRTFVPIEDLHASLIFAERSNFDLRSNQSQSRFLSLLLLLAPTNFGNYPLRQAGSSMSIQFE